MPRDFARFMELAGQERADVALAITALPLVALALRCASFSSVRRRLQPAVARSLASSVAPARTARLVAAAARRFPFEISCVPRALVLHWLLARRGVACELRIGVNKEDGFSAHAWVEAEGRPLMEPADIHDRFAPFSPLPRDPA